jgi:hypothetical protein
MLLTVSFKGIGVPHWISIRGEGELPAASQKPPDEKEAPGKPEAEETTSMDGWAGTLFRRPDDFPGALILPRRAPAIKAP